MPRKKEKEQKKNPISLLASKGRKDETFWKVLFYLHFSAVSTLSSLPQQENPNTPGTHTFRHKNYLNSNQTHKVYFTHLKGRRMLLWNITVARLLMGIVATSCTIFIDCWRLLLIGLRQRYICCCFGMVCVCFSFRCNMRRVSESVERRRQWKKRRWKGKMRKIDLLSYGDKEQHHERIRGEKDYFIVCRMCANLLHS